MLKTILKNALEREEIVLHFQPVIHMRSGKTVGWEGLARWQHQGEWISPADFLPDVTNNEELQRALVIGQLRQLNEAFALVPSDCWLSFNLSLSALLWEDMGGLIKQNIQDPRRVLIEVPESEALGKHEVHVLGHLKETGVDLGIDDFGAAQAGFARFLSGIFDAVKIDVEFVKGCEADERKQKLIGALTTLADYFEMSVIAEGPANEAEVECLLGLGVELGQGFYLGMPVSKEELPGWTDKGMVA